jgi:hypothetical protein
VHEEFEEGEPEQEAKERYSEIRNGNTKEIGVWARRNHITISEILHGAEKWVPYRLLASQIQIV